ncbi:MAG: response regulator [Candidatus Scalinduaceae bacterium]
MKEIKILLIEDDLDHADLITEVLEENNIEKEVILIKDGQEAIDYFEKVGMDEKEDATSKVELILLDLKLPKVDGMEVLKFLKKNPRYCSIPVVILTTTSEHKTVIAGYKNGVNSFITKPISFEEFVEKIKILKKYWLKTCTLPIR